MGVEELDVGYDHGYTASMKTAISIPDDVFQAAEELSKRLGMSRSELYARAVAAFIKSHKRKRVKETLDAIYATEDSRLEPALMALQALSLPREEW
jgi:metal-responsive CopG/Arc/MetJ family transcriptional regulator